MQHHDQPPQEEGREDTRAVLLLGTIALGMILAIVVLIWLGSALEPFRPIIAGACVVFFVLVLALLAWRCWMFLVAGETFIPRRSQKQITHMTYEDRPYREGYHNEREDWDQ